MNKRFNKHAWVTAVLSAIIVMWLVLIYFDYNLHDFLVVLIFTIFIVEYGERYHRLIGYSNDYCEYK